MPAPHSWRPDKAALRPPIYRSLLKQLEQDIHSGSLPPHTRLPAQRELADYLGVNLSTVTRVLKLCEKKGLIYATVGRGTFVSPDVGLPYPSFLSGEGSVQMGRIKPFYQCNPIVLDTAARLFRDRDAARLFQYRQPDAARFHKRAAQLWLSWFHISAAPEHILLANSSGSALALSLSAFFSPGDAIAADPCTTPSLLHFAGQMRLRVIPVEGDAQGMLPDALARQFGLSKIRGVYLSPTCQNPTGRAMPAVRRKEIAKVCERYNLVLLEDDPYLFLAHSGALPFASILPEQTIHIHSISKALAPLGIAYITAPPHLRQRLKSAAEALPPSLLNAEIVSALVSGGAALRILSQKRRLAAARSRIAQRYFPLRPGENPYGLFRFLPMPEGYDGARFEQLAKSRGVQVLCSERFAVDRKNRHAFRAALCSPATEDELERGLQILKALAAGQNHEPPGV